ncbi:hypothetical protein BU202_09320 [Streptococcus cuniculi]|uniref:Uncharacterized protein n=1 Tax=Streptococcus cuniculi TaxID=1432788 RepID=A0A1Q8E5Q8_9STRE|nr:hypothetical protein BU202_09320 [Streptococcus cuniculi]
MAFIKATERCPNLYSIHYNMSQYSKIRPIWQNIVNGFVFVLCSLKIVKSEHYSVDKVVFGQKKTFSRIFRLKSECF